MQIRCGLEIPWNFNKIDFSSLKWDDANFGLTPIFGQLKELFCLSIPQN